MSADILGWRRGADVLDMVHLHMAGALHPEADIGAFRYDDARDELSLPPQPPQRPISMPAP